MEVVEHEPLGRRVEEVGEREACRRPLRAEMAPPEQVDRHRAARDRRRLRDEEQRCVRPQPPERRERGDERVEVRAEPRDLPPVEARHREDVAVRRRPHRLDEVPDVEAAAPEGAVLQDGERPQPDGERRRRGTDETCGPASPPASARSSSDRQRRPRTSSEACASYVARPAAREPLGQPPARPATRRSAAASAPGPPAGRAAHRRRRSGAPARRASTAVITRPRAGERLEDLVRDHARRLVARAEDPERAPGGAVRLGQLLVVEPGDVRDVRRPGVEQGACWPSPTIRMSISGASSAAARIVSRPWSGISFPTKSAWNGSGGCQPGRKRGSSAPTRATATRPSAEPEHAAEERGVGLRVRDHEIGCAEGGLVDGAHDAGGRRPRPEPPRSPTSVSWSETSGLKTTGRPRATRRAAGMSK